MTHLKLTEKKRFWMGTRPAQPLATKMVADRKMGLVPNKKGSPIIRYERIEHLVIPILCI